MNKKVRRFLLVINLFLLVFLISAILVPVKRKTVKYSNTNIDTTNRRENVSKVGTITNNKNAEFSFELYNEKLYGVCLFFCVEGKDENGEIVCTLEYNGEKVGQTSVSIKELLFRMKANELSAKELLFGDIEKRDGKYTLILEGKELSPDTRVSFYGNESTEKYLKYENNIYQDYYEALYIIEVVGESNPYIWNMMFIFVLSLLFSYLIYMKDKEKSVEPIK